MTENTPSAADRADGPSDSTGTTLDLPASSQMPAVDTTDTSLLDPHLLSTRDAPESPASSRPSSAIFSGSPSASPSRTASPSAAGATGRDRSGSATSVSSKGKRAPSAKRKSLLGGTSTLPDDVGDAGEQGVPSTIPELPASSCEPDSLVAEKVKEDPLIEHIETTKPDDLTHPDGPEPAPETESEVAPPKRYSPKKTTNLVIRDYAYSPSDELFHGVEEEPWGNTGTDSDWGKSKPDADEDDEETRFAGGWGGFGLFGWRRGQNRESLKDDQQSEDAMDMAATAATDEDYDSSPPPSESDVYGYSFNILPALDSAIEPSGMYRAAYAFEGMGASEMSVDEGELLLLTGRGNGNPGWVIARRMRVDDGKVVRSEAVGLVPESYLERVEVLGVEQYEYRGQS